MSNEKPENKAKPPSELSLELFVARIEADKTIPESLAKAVGDHKGKSAPALFGAIKTAIGEIK